MKNIVLHDYFQLAEGGGRLSATVANCFDMDIAYGFSRNNHPFLSSLDTKVFQHVISTHIPIPILKQYHLCCAFQKNTKFLENYKTAFYSGFYTPLAIQNHLNRKNIYYCHTPPRFIYDQKDFYFSLTPKILHPLLSWFVYYLKPKYELSVRNMDTVITNSIYVQKRIKEHLGLDSIIIPPPCEVNYYSFLGQNNYYVSTGRLDPLKRIDLIIKAFIKMPNKNLVVLSGGSELPKLKYLARNSKNIKFTGWVDNEQFKDILGNCIATIYIPKNEDFGMSPVESMASGKPVIGVAEGGLLETVKNEQTGLLLNPNLDQHDLISAITKMSSAYALSLKNNCIERSKLFSVEIFLEKLKEFI